jgi:hypothetical protein
VDFSAPAAIRGGLKSRPGRLLWDYAPAANHQRLRGRRSPDRFCRFDKEFELGARLASDLDAIKDAIDAFTQDGWKATKRAVLLTHVGTHLRKLGLWPLPGPKISLSEFVRTHLAGRVRLEQAPANPLSWALFPADAELEEDKSSYFSIMPRPQMEALAAPTYLPFFWAAFAKPIPQGMNRYIVLATQLFRDVASPDARPDGSFEVCPDDIPPENIENRAAEIVKRIKEWSNRCNVELRQFEDTSRPQKKKVTIPARSALDHLLDALTDKDLVRVQMPLDVVAKLRRYRD